MSVHLATSGIDDVGLYQRDQSAGRPDRWCRRGQRKAPPKGNSIAHPPADTTQTQLQVVTAPLPHGNGMRRQAGPAPQRWEISHANAGVGDVRH